MDKAINTGVPHSIPVKLYRTADRLVIAAPMAGMRPEDVTIEVTVSGCLILQSRPRGALWAELFDVAVTVDRDGDQEVWTREQWQETKDVVLDEWSTRVYYRQLELPLLWMRRSGPSRMATGYSSSRCRWQKQFALHASSSHV